MHKNILSMNLQMFADNATLNYAESYQQGLQKRYSENGILYSQKLWNSPSNNLIKWAGAKTVKLPKLLIKNGRKDRTRRAITNASANYENQWETYELTNERYWDTLVDPSDIDETNYVTSIVNITKAYNDLEKIPEKDKQMFSSLYNLKKTKDGGKGIVELELTTENILTQFDTMMTAMDEAAVPAIGRSLYVTPTVSTILKNAQGLQRTLSVQNNNGVIDRAVKRLDEVTIEPAVPSAYMKTVYDFTTGAVADPTAQTIQMMLIHIPCMCAPEKYSFVGLDKPSASTAGNYLYYEQSYDDVILFETKSDGLSFVVTPKQSDGGGE
ncbi:capsid protein [Enterococcus faecium]|uniref:capsid protein n=1 Tax=Enterococcus faecium TaxID=1352 RepID=UPI000DEB3D2D|nr:capsid protein [Enterococcus faecium]EGP5171816.1 capsid protein [Enterococcus faecium]RBS57518.1 hypothetical protein EB35_00952 [Enterococcus faecium]